MLTLTFAPVSPANPGLSVFELNGYGSLFVSRRKPKKKDQPIVPVARLFGPAIFEASKLKVLFLGVDEKKHPGKLPRAYTLTHSDITSKLTLAIAQTINNSQLQGWANKIYKDEVVAEWKKVKGKMSLHVHCHISGGHFLLDLCARLRYFIFSKELPVVLKAFVHGDGHLLKNYPELQESLVWVYFHSNVPEFNNPELQESLVWVYFHSNVPEFNRVECWGPLVEAAASSSGGGDGCDGWQQEEKQEMLERNWERPQPCQDNCNCCFPPKSLIPWSPKHTHENEKHGHGTQSGPNLETIE